MEGSVKSRVSCYALRLVSFVFVSMLRSKIDHEDAIFNFPIYFSFFFFCNTDQLGILELLSILVPRLTVD